MYLGLITIGDNLTFTVNTHTPATGAAVDADAVPDYRVYEDETAVPILTGSMALLDDANTTGFYSEQIAVTAANGFEAGKSYTIRITGVVGGVTGVEIHTFGCTAADIDDVKTDTAAILLDTGTDGVVVAGASKTGYALAATGLDAITATAPATVASTFPQMVVQLWRRFFKKATMTATQVKTYADDGATVVTTQTVSDDSTTQTQGAAT